MNSSIRVRENDVKQDLAFSGVLQEIYKDDLDAAVVHGAFTNAVIEAAAHKVESAPLNWNHPNRGMAGNDIEILGTDTPATPTFTNPRGASLEAYLSSASSNLGKADGIFPAGYSIQSEIQKLLGTLAGGLPVELAVASDGRKYVPYTLRRLPTGQEISLHHDYYYQMGLYADLAPRLDHSTLLSFLLIVQKPEAGGDLVMYELRSDDPAQPRLPSGRWDSQAIQNGYPETVLTTESGDFLLLASGRYFHRVKPVVGARSRITLGGFLGLTRDHSKVLYWS